MLTGHKGTTSILAEPNFFEDQNGEICSDVQRKILADAYVQEILSYLPASNLQTLKIVCKDWLQLITTPYFVKLHLSRANRSRIPVLMPFPSEIIEYNYNEGTKHIPYPPKFSGSNTTILGSADGLICMVDENTKETSAFTLFNPSTRKCFGVKFWWPLPTFYNIICYWFGKHLSGVDGKYVLVMGIFSPGPCYEFGVYKFTRSQLKRTHSVFVDMQVPYPGCLICPDKGTLVHGAVHWAVRQNTNHQSRYIIMAYHIDKNKYWEISPPAQREFRVGVVDGCLFSIHKNEMSVFEVWVMKESWTKYANIEGFNNSLVLCPLGFFPSGDLILDVDNSQLLKYSFKDNKGMVLMQYGRVIYNAIMCADSLVSPVIWKDDRD